MSWLYETLTVPSSVNGAIRCVRFLGRWSVTVGDTGQANEYLNALWRKALRHIPRDAAIRRILVLGFGTGRAIPEFIHRFPRAHITSIEIDPVMVTLAKQFQTLHGYPWPEVHVGAAKDVLPALHGQYDLIVSDMFLGHAVAPESVHADVLREIIRLLHPQGHVLFNAYDQPEALSVFETQLIEAGRWKYLINHVGYFRQHGSGVFGDALPKGYVPYPSCPEYLKREYHAWHPFEVVRAGEAWGVRQRIGPFSIERYVTPHEPRCEPGGFRLVIWDPVIPVPHQPRGWHRLFFGAWRALTGYVDLTLPGDAHAGWSALACRELKKWMAQDAYEIREITLEDYCRAYASSGKRSLLIRLFSASLHRRAERHGGRLHVWGAVSRVSGDVCAGLVTLDIPEIHTTLHVTGFVLRDGTSPGAGTGLVDHWLAASRAADLRYADFDGFYAPGMPKEWKGFSRFKGQFGTRYIAYPLPFWRFIH